MEQMEQSSLYNHNIFHIYVLQDFEFILERKYKKALGLDFSKYETLCDSRIQEYEVLYNDVHNYYEINI